MTRALPSLPASRHRTQILVMMALFASVTSAWSESRGVGVVIHKLAQQNDEFANVIVFTSIEDFPQTLTVHGADGKPHQVRKAELVLIHKFPAVIRRAEILTDSKGEITAAVAQLREIHRKYPNARRAVDPHLAEGELILEKLNTGHVKADGKWTTLAEHSALLAERKRIQDERNRQFELERKMAHDAAQAEQQRKEEEQRLLREAAAAAERKKLDEDLARARMRVDEKRQEEQRQSEALQRTVNLALPPSNRADRALVDAYVVVEEEIQNRILRGETGGSIDLGTKDSLTALRFHDGQEVGKIGSQTVVLYRSGSDDSIAALTVIDDGKIICLELVCFATSGTYPDMFVSKILPWISGPQPEPFNEWLPLGVAISSFKNRLSGQSTFTPYRVNTSVYRKIGAAHIAVNAVNDMTPQDGDGETAIRISIW